MALVALQVYQEHLRPRARGCFTLQGSDDGSEVADSSRGGQRYISSPTNAIPGTFYAEHAEEIDGLRQPTLDFNTGRQSEIFLSGARVIDMTFGVAGRHGD